MKLLRIVSAAIAAAIAWGVGLGVVFGPAQLVLSDPARQSAKFLAAFTQEPLPRMAESAWVAPLGLLLVGMCHACVYAWLAPKLSGTALRKGVLFGVMAWALMVPWFEFYLPYNVMHEPLALALLEAACWLVVQVVVGIAIALVNAAWDRVRGVHA